MTRRSLQCTWLLASCALAAAAAFAGCDDGSVSTDLPEAGPGYDAGPKPDAGVDATVSDSSSDSASSDSGGNDGSPDGANEASGDDAGSDGASDAGSGDAAFTSETGIVGDAGPGGDAAVLACGAAACARPSESCCVFPTDAGYLMGCVNGGSCPVVGDAGQSTALSCEVQSQCTGNTICCLIANNSNGNISSQCRASCSSSGGETAALLCDPTSGDAGCKDAGACSSSNIGTWNLPPGYGTCGGIAK